jgi:hypothetical protein
VVLVEDEVVASVQVEVLLVEDEVAEDVVVKTCINCMFFYVSKEILIYL